MSRKLLITQKQITAICKGASKAGHVPIIEIDGLNVRLVPVELTERLNQKHDKSIDKPLTIRF